MLNSFKFWTFLLPGGLLALLVRGSTPDPTSLLVAQVRRTFEESKVIDTATLTNSVLTVGGGTQIPADAHLTFNPVILFHTDFPQQPAGAAPIQVTEPGTQLPQNGT
jgi:hypothetical protein